MPTYKVTDPVSGKTLKLTGDSPPTEAELNEIFGGGEVTPKPQEVSPVMEQRHGAVDTFQNIGRLYPAAETAATLATSAYGVPASGIAGALTLPVAAGAKALGLTERDPLTVASDVVKGVQGKLVYQPQTEGGRQLTEAAAYPLEKIDQLGGYAGGKLERAGYPNTGAAVHSAITASPMLIPGVKPTVKGAGRLVMDYVKPKPDEAMALRQVIQGKTKDIPKGKEALSAINTEGVKTYKDLNQRIESRITDLARLVDKELSMDSTKYPIADLVTKTPTKGGTVIVQNHVADALAHLKELYEKTNDPIKGAGIDRLSMLAETDGLTKKQVNDIARVYGYEYKAFNPKSGEQLTSINSKAYENTRKGLKEIAREGMPSEVKELDHTLSSLMNTQRLIEKNIETANSLRQRVDPRSLGEKIGRAVGYALDWGTGGTVKGLIGKFLPRGVGNKMLNMMDLEEKLSRNLEILREAERKHNP